MKVVQGCEWPSQYTLHESVFHVPNKLTFSQLFYTYNSTNILGVMNNEQIINTLPLSAWAVLTSLFQLETH